MKKLAITVISLFVVASASHASMQVLPPVAPVVGPPAAVAGGQKMIGWRTGPVSCAGSPVVPSALPTPLERYGWISAEGVPTKSITLTFDIDRAGRPHAIKRSGPTYVLYGDDLDATLATASFAPGAERTGCTVTYDLDVAAIDAAPIERLIAYSLFPVGQRLPQAGFDRVRRAASANSTCGDPAPAVRRRIYPDFKAIPQAPATRSWSMISFDIDAQGKPFKARVFRSTGNAALDRASVKAVAD